MSVDRSLIAPTSKPLLEGALKEKLLRRAEATGSLGELEPLAIRLGLMQNTLKPRFRDPQLVIFAADHGLAVDGVAVPQRKQTHEQVRQLLTGQLPVAVFARIQGLELSVVDCGVADMVSPHDRLIRRKIAHGTRNARVEPAMSVDQAHAAIRAGMEIGDTLRGNLVAVAGIGVGSHESAALVLARLTDSPVRGLLLISEIAARTPGDNSRDGFSRMRPSRLALRRTAASSNGQREVSVTPTLPSAPEPAR